MDIYEPTTVYWYYWCQLSLNDKVGKLLKRSCWQTRREPTRRTGNFPGVIHQIPLGWRGGSFLHLHLQRGPSSTQSKPHFLCYTPQPRNHGWKTLSSSVVVPGAAATSPPPPVIFSQVAASRFRGSPPPPPVIFASRRPRHIFWQTTIFTNGSDEMPFLQCDYYIVWLITHWHMHSLGSFRDTPDSKLLTEFDFLSPTYLPTLVWFLSFSTIELVLFAILRSAVAYVTEECFYF
jgi:hypothetical protein